MTATTADARPPELRLPKRRGVELSLLIGAVIVSVYGYAAVGLARNDAVPPDVAGYGDGLGVLALLAHLAVRFRAPFADPLLLPIAVLLNGLGLVLMIVPIFFPAVNGARKRTARWASRASRPRPAPYPATSGGTALFRARPTAA